MLPALELPALSDGNVSRAKPSVAALAIIFQQVRCN
jgi:hypothetical protein